MSNPHPESLEGSLVSGRDFCLTPAPDIPRLGLHVEWGPASYEDKTILRDENWGIDMELNAFETSNIKTRENRFNNS